MLFVFVSACRVLQAADQAPSSETGINPDQKINRNSIDGFGVSEGAHCT
jgi:hypothetical protein